jgi:plasmid stabilization system protein ParE
MTFHVNLSHAATADVRAILRWIAERSPQGSEAWYRRWLEVLDSLKQRADEFALAPESQQYPEPIRQVIFKTKHGRPYRAVFTIRDADVFVLHVRGPGQRLLKPDELRGDS